MNKIFSSLAWIVTFFLSLFGIVYIIIPELLPFKLNLFLIKMILLNVCIVYLILTILKFCSLFKRKKDYEINAPEGKIIVSTSSIKMFVLKTLENDNNISIVSVEPYKKGKNFNLKIELELLNNTNLSEKIIEIQEKLQDSGKKILGIEISSVSLKVTKIKFPNTEVH